MSRHSVYAVSILILLDAFLLVDIDEIDEMWDIERFQSLFYWMLFF